jgi:hypothetical protein
VVRIGDDAPRLQPGERPTFAGDRSWPRFLAIPAEALIAGSIDEVAAQFRNLAEIGYTDILVRHLTNDQPKVLGSLERLAAVRAALT